MQAITAGTGVSALCRREAVILVCADLLATGVCVVLGVSLVRSDKSAGCGFVEAPKVNIRIDCLAWGWD